MFGKRKKKLDRKMRRRIRKTSAVMLLISAITVAAIPVPEAAAAGEGITLYASDPETVTPDMVKTNSVVAIPDKDTAGNILPGIGTGIIPYIDSDQTIYTDDTGRYLFACVEDKDRKFMAVLLQCNDADEETKIPSSVALYIQNETKNSFDGTIAANKYGQPLYYKETRTMYFQRALPGDEKTRPTMDTSGTDEWSGLSYIQGKDEIKIYKDGDPSNGGVSIPEWDGNQWTQEIRFHTYRYRPCLASEVKGGVNPWNEDGVRHYIYTAPPEGSEGYDMSAADWQFYSLPQDDTFKDWSVKENTIAAVLSSHKYDNNSEGGAHFSATNDVDNGWRSAVDVGYISDQTYATDANGKWIAGPSRLTSDEKSFFPNTAITTKLTLPDSIKAIADYAFYNSTSLNEINLNDCVRLEAVGSYAFAGCSSMTKFDLKSNCGIKAFSDHMLDGCRALQEIPVPKSTTMICDSAFKDCGKNSSTGEFKIDFSGADSLETIGNYAFAGSNLREIELPDTITDIGWYNFEGCTNLKKATIESNVGSGIYESSKENGLRFNNFKGCTNLECIDVISGSTLFDDTEDYAFNAEAFKETVSDEFYFIGNDRNAQIHNVTAANAIAFMYRTTEIYEKINRKKDETGSVIEEITYQVNKNNELVSLAIKGNVKDIAIEGKIGPYSIEKIDSKVSESIKTQARNLESLTIPTTIIEIGAGAFQGCSSLREVHFAKPQPGDPGYNVVIKDNAFQTESDLRFYGEIREGYAPFEYAMNPNNTTYANRTVYIDYCTGAPENLHVHYDPDRGTSTLFKVPTTPRLELLLKNEAMDDPNADPEDLSNLEASREYVDHLREVLRSKEINAGIDEAELAKDIVDLISEYRKSGKVIAKYSVHNDVKDAVGAAFDIEIPAGVKSIAENLFSKASEDDTKETTENLANGSTITERAIYGMYPNKEDGATGPNFVANNDIRSITMYDVGALDPYAFYGCENLNTVKMCSSGKAGGETIGDYAFGQCKALDKVYLPSTTSEMGRRPFAGAGAGKNEGDPILETVYFIGDTPPAENVTPSESGENFLCDRSIIYGTVNDKKDSVVECLESRGSTSLKLTLVGSDDNDELNGINSIKDEAFMNCSEISTVDLSTSNIKAIPEYCFDNAVSLNTLTLPSTCTTVRRYAMKDTALSKLTTYTTFENNVLYDSDERNGHIVNKLIVECPKSSPVWDWVEEHEMYKWEPTEKIPEYTISFYDSTGELIDARSFKESTTIGVEPDSEKMAAILKKHEDAGETFDKWDSFTPYIPVSQDMDVRAVYKDLDARRYTVTFINDGKPYATFTGENAIRYNTYIPQVDNPTSPYDGYVFDGWYNDDGYSPKDLVTSDRVFYAQYRPTSGGTTSGNDPNDPNNPNNPNNPNDPNNPNGSNNGNNTTSGNNANGTLYTLTVVNGSGSGSYAAGTQVTVAAYTPNTGYAFNNWTSSESDTDFTSKTLAATSFKMPAKNLTVTANYITKSETGSNITSKLTPGTVTSAPASNTGSVNRVDSSSGSNGNGGSSVQVNRPGISNGDVASATVNGSTDNFVVKVTEDGHATAAVAEALRNEYGSLDNIRYFAMDISLYDETGTRKVADTSGLSVTMTLPIPDELRQYAGNNKVGAVTGGNNLDKLNARFTTVNGVPCVTFTATHFSPYTVYVDTANLSAGGYDATPKTGDAIHPKWFLAIGLALFSAVLFLKKDKKVSYNAA